jgi:membrane protease YdiL (CAAX protease family)
VSTRYRVLNWLHAQFEDVDRTVGNGEAGPGFDRRTAIVLGTVLLVLFLMQYGARSSELQLLLADKGLAFLGSEKGISIETIENRLAFGQNLVWVLGSLFAYIVIPVFVIRCVLHARLADFGLGVAGYWRHFPVYIGLFLPVFLGVFAVSMSDSFQDTYPFYRDPETLWMLLVWEVLYGLQFLGLEVFFRGFLLHGLARRYGSGAIWMMLLPYVMIHFTKPILEALGAVFAGTVLALMSLRTRSIWGGVTIHVAVAWTMDALVLSQTGWWD